MRVLKLWGLICAILIIISLFLPGCKTEKAATDTADDTLYVGIATALTGPTGMLGTVMMRGVQMAMDEQNTSGGVTIAGEKYTLKTLIVEVVMTRTNMTIIQSILLIPPKLKINSQ